MLSPLRALVLAALGTSIAVLLHVSPALAQPVAAASLHSPDTSTGRVVLAPLNLGVEVAPALETAIEPVWQALLAYYESETPRAGSLHPGSAGELWTSTMASFEEGSAKDVHAVYGAFARRVAEQVEFGTLLMPVVVTRAATLRGAYAHWDGVRQRAPVSDDLLPSASWRLNGSDLEVRGKLGAASLLVVALDANGNVLFEGKGGLDLVHQIERRGQRLQTVARSDAFEDPRRLREGVERALSFAVPAAPAP